MNPQRNKKPDGYIRLPMSELCLLKPFHLLTRVDSDARPLHLSTGAAGFTEWILESEASTKPISLGWDWFQDPATQQILIGEDDVRTNLMLIHASGCDLGLFSTSVSLKNWLDSIPWAASVRAAIGSTVDALRRVEPTWTMPPE